MKDTRDEALKAADDPAAQLPRDEYFADAAALETNAAKLVRALDEA